MSDLLQSNTFWVLVGFHVGVLLILVLDLGILQRKAHVVTKKEAGAWTALWVSLALLFALGVGWFRGKEAGFEFVTGYVIELSLSVDNLFVFLVIFRYFAVPEKLRHRVLFWGILGAVFMRAGFILVGDTLLKHFHWMIYVFGGLLIYTGIKLLKAGAEELDPGRNPVLRVARRIFPIVDNYDSTNFWVRHQGKWFATPMFLVLLVIESTDVVFAVDSIPAIFAVTKDIFVVYTSNIFAILGLRAMYFLLAGFLGMFRYLNVGLACVLMFVGVKMLLQDYLEPTLAANGIEKVHVILFSLSVIASILTISIVASIIAGPKKHIGHPPEVVLEPEAEARVASGESTTP